MERIASGELYTSYKFGAWTLASLCDGYADMPVTRLRHSGNKTFGPDLPPQLRLVGGALRLSVNAFALDDGTAITLFDTGSANAWYPTVGLLPKALHAAKIDVERIRTVAFTHTHVDHINGLVLPNGQSAFPQLSRLFVPEEELGLFHAETRLARFHDLAEPFAAGRRLGRDIETIDAHGHEVGHTCFRVTSGGETLLIWGDIVHVPSLQFGRPEITWEFDTDQEQARDSRLRMMALAADNGYYVAGAHLDSPGVGRVLRSENSFRFDPL